jgi:hypothetical protein
LLQGAAMKLLSMAVVALPALWKARSRKLLSDNRESSERLENDPQVIEVKAIPVDDKEKLP